MNTRRITRIFPLCLLVLGTTCSSASPSQTVRNYWGLLEDGDTEAIINLCSKRRLNEPQNIGVSQVKEAFKTFSKELKDRGGLTSIEIQKEDILRDAAEVKAVVRRGDGGRWEASHKLVKEGGVWKLDAVNSQEFMH